MTDYEDLQVYGRVGLTDDKMIVVKKTRADTYKYFDIRQFVHSDDPNEYTGPTKKGITIPTDRVDAIKKLRDALNKLIEVNEEEEDEEEEQDKEE